MLAGGGGGHAGTDGLEIAIVRSAVDQAHATALDETANTGELGGTVLSTS